MEIDENKYTPLAIGLFIAIGVFTVILLALVPLFRNKEIAIEMDRYDLETNKKEPKDVYDYPEAEISFRFENNGVYINDRFFWYNHIKIFITTSNDLNRIWIKVVFYIDENEYYGIPLNAEIISTINKNNVKLENPETLNYIIFHKEDAFKQIYKTGKIKHIFPDIQKTVD